MQEFEDLGRQVQVKRGETGETEILTDSREEQTRGDEWSSPEETLIYHFRQPNMIPSKVPRYKPWSLSSLSLPLF